MYGLGEWYSTNRVVEGTNYETENRSGTMTRMVGALRRQVIERKELSKTTKLRVINAMVVATLLYGRETWTLQKRHRSRIQAMEIRYLRKIGVTRLDRVSNEDIRRRLRVEAVLAVVDRKKKGSGERGLKECHRRDW